MTLVKFLFLFIVRAHKPCKVAHTFGEGGRMKIKSLIQRTATLFSVVFFFSGVERIFARAQGEWELISSYTTYYNEEERARSENIAIAVSLIDNLVVQAYGEFSFNQTVGRRTAEAGFQSAKIIVNGEYALGVGGGVCQVSTTLYNAALKSGLEVLEYHPHSLRVNYVPPSRDAMVSSQSDLKLFNAHGYAVRLRATVRDGSVRVAFYGKNEGDRYEITSVMLAEIPPPPPIVKVGETDGFLREPKNGVQSEAYIERYRGNALLSKKRLRKDEYRPIQGVLVKKNENPTE